MADFESFFEQESQKKNVVYTRPFQLPINVAFKIIEWQQCESKYSKQKTSRVLLYMDQFVSLQVYPGSKYDSFSEDKMDAMNAAIAKGQSWYMVARNWTSQERVPIDVLSEEKRKEQNTPVFDCNVHVITKFDSRTSCGGSDDGLSPKKKKFV